MSEKVFWWVRLYKGNVDELWVRPVNTFIAKRFHINVNKKWPVVNSALHPSTPKNVKYVNEKIKRRKKLSSMSPKLDNASFFLLGPVLIKSFKKYQKLET